MRKIFLVSLALCLMSLAAFSQDDKSKRPSPPASATCTLGNGSTISIHYSSPRAKGRPIYGSLVPYGEVWRTGANEATTFDLSGDVVVGRTKVAKGKYTLFTIPEKDKWVLIVNKQTGQWGTEYDQKNDLVRIDIGQKSLPAAVENFTISFESKGGSCGLQLDWATTRAFVDITAAK
jgi:hypothetical protein